MSILRERAGREADAVALRDAESGISLDYAALVACVDRARADLAGLGIEAGAVVAVVSPTPFLSALLFLALGPHVTVAPVPAATTEAELAASLDQIAPAAVVVTAQGGQHAALAAERGIAVVVAHHDAQAGLGLELLSPAEHSGRQLATPGLLLTTSGTTGRPKMVSLDPARLAAGAAKVAATLALEAGDTSVTIMPLHHIHGLVAGLLAPVLFGGGTVIRPDAAPEGFLATAAETGASWYTAVPTMHHAILRAAKADSRTAQACAFRVIRSSSSAMPAAVRAGLAETFGCPVVEAYGMTEATHQIACQRPADPAAHGTVGPVDPDAVRIVDPQGADVADGGTGEVVIRGETVIAGYLDNPEATASAFDGGWMRTGDIGRIGPDGHLVLVARAKEMVKRGGAQVAPTEVEDALLSLPGVVEAIAFGVTHPTLGQDLGAAVVLDPDTATDARLLRAALLERLSDYKVPSRILALTEIPKGPTGKPRRLEMETLLAEDLAPSFKPPADPVESLLAALFAEAIGVERIGRDDDFFLAGGDSLSGTSMMVHLNALLDTVLNPEVLFHYPTPAELAAHVGSLDGGRVAELLAGLAADTAHGSAATS